MRNYRQTGPRFTVTGGHAVAVRDQERDSSRVEHPWEQVHEQTTQERKVVLRPRAGVVSARALLPLVAATSSFPACPQPSATAAPAAAPDAETATARVSQLGQRAWSLLAIK